MELLSIKLKFGSIQKKKLSRVSAFLLFILRLRTIHMRLDQRRHSITIVIRYELIKAIKGVIRKIIILRPLSEKNSIAK